MRKLRQSLKRAQREREGKKYLLILLVRKFRRLVFLTATYYSHGPAPAISHSLQPDNKILSIRSRSSDFWLCQELNESQSSSVLPVLTCLQRSPIYLIGQTEPKILRLVPRFPRVSKDCWRCYQDGVMSKHFDEK